MKPFITILLILVTIGNINAQELNTNVRALSYDAYYNWGILWVHAGQVDFKLSKSNKYSDALKLEAHGYSLPSWDWVFKVRDTLVSHYNHKTFYPYEFERLSREGKYHKDFRYRFDYSDTLIYSKVQRLGQKLESDKIRIEPQTFDLLSVAWMARELDFEQLKVNEQIPIKLLIDRKIHELYIRYLGIDTIKIKSKRRECYIFSPLLVQGTMFKEGEGMKIYISKDEHRIPLLVQAEILVGSVKAIINLDDCNLTPVIIN